jgi:sugar phosphate permease
MLVFESTTPITVLAALILVLGIPNGFQSLGLQTALYEAAPVKEMGAAAGLFQTFRYVCRQYIVHEPARTCLQSWGHKRGFAYYRVGNRCCECNIVGGRC